MGDRLAPTCRRANEPQVFWHLDVYPTRAAAQGAKVPQGTVIKSFGRVWLLTIAAEGWRPQGGKRVAQIGPLPITPGQDYSAQYMEAIVHSRNDCA